jgi:phosphatidylethanolamine/phosphatidyl-N-methylethanolamine N-methyltransferase
MKLTNRWNRFIYCLWAPIYDGTVDHIFLPGRKQAFRLLDLKPGERLLLVGIGTGADLPLLPEGVEAVGVDLSPVMLRRAHSKLPLRGREVRLILGDAHNLLVEEETFDAVVFNLILSVIPDGSACLRENLRALKGSGRAVVFDKFAPESGRLSLLRRLLNGFSTLFGTDITRRFGDLLKGSGGRIIQQEDSILGGKYQVILLKREISSS